MSSKLVLKSVTLLVLLGVLIGLTGCSMFGKKVTLHPISQADIVSMPEGKSYTPSKDGWFLSDYYVEEVMKAKIDE